MFDIANNGDLKYISLIGPLSGNWHTVYRAGVRWKA
jgi:hypothetical protein